MKGQQLASFNSRKPIVLAVRYNSNPNVIDYLMENHADINASDDKASMMLVHSAARWNPNPDVMEILIQHGVDPNQNDSLRTPMHYAAAHNSNTKVLQVLYDHGGCVNLDDSRIPKDHRPNSPLHYAAKHNKNVEISKWLIEHGANANEENANGETPLDYAVSFNPNVDVIKFYYGLHCISDNNSEKMRILCQAIKQRQEHEIIRFLAEQVKDINAWHEGLPPLHYAKDAMMVEILVELGANVHEKNQYGYTMFDIAEESYNSDIMEMLDKYEGK